MSAGDVAAIILAVVAAVLAAFLCVALVSITRTMRTLREAVEQLRRETVPVVTGLQTTVTRAGTELERVGTLLGRAESISTTLDSGSRLAYLAFSNPVIKFMAVGSGIGRATRRLRKAR